MSVVVAIQNGSGTDALVRWGHHLAHGMGTPLIVLHGSDMVDAAAEIPTWLAPLEAPPQPDHEDPVGIETRVIAIEEVLQARHVLDAVDSESAQLVLMARRGGAGQDETLTHDVFDEAPCAVMVLRHGGHDGLRCSRVLIPQSGGPHAKRALAILGGVCARLRAEVTALMVAADTDVLAADAARERLKQMLDELKLADAEHIVPEVVSCNNPAEGIARVAEAGDPYDLIVLGVPRPGLIRRLLFGTIPDRVVEGPDKAAVAVFRKELPASIRVRERIERTLNRVIPQLSRDERIHLVNQLQDESRWSVDFFMLISLSTAIAALGLLQDSAAVVIGAMLVAPLMTPLLGAGLAVAQGNLPLVTTAVRSVTLGYLTALGIGVLVGLCTPYSSLTTEMASRGGPTLLDMGIAFLSGIAAAYCVGRPNLSAALPGVAISAALVPPIATTGICLAIGETETARGASLLFATNVVAVVLGATSCLYGAGVRASIRKNRLKRWVQRVMIALIILTGILSIPLASLLVARASGQMPVPVEVSESLDRIIRETVSTQLPDATVSHIRTAHKRKIWVFDITITSVAEADQALADALMTALKHELERPLLVRIHKDRILEAKSDLP